MFRRTLLARDLKWGVWIGWFEFLVMDKTTAHLGVHDLSVYERVELAEKSNEFWDREPAEINAEIMSWVEAESISLDQGPAQYRYQIEGGAIVATPQTGEAVDSIIADAMIGELIEKAKEHQSNAADAGNNHPKRINNNAEKLLAVLEGWASEPNLGGLLMRQRSLEADIRAFAKDERLYADELAAMEDLAASCDDLIALFPFAQKLRANALALRLQNEDVPAINTQLDLVESEAKKSAVVSVSAKAALADGGDLIVQTTETIETSSDENAVATAIEQRTEITAGRVLSFKNFGAELVRAEQDGVIDGTKSSASAGTKVGFALLVGAVAGPFVALGTYIASLRKVGREAEKLGQKEDGTEKIDV